MQFRFNNTFLFVVTSLTCLSTTLKAEENKFTEVIYITSERIAASRYDTPYSVEQFNQNHIQENLFRSVPEVFSNTPGVLVQKTAFGQGSPYIRGFTGFRTLFLQDGVKLNNSVFREGPNQYWATVDAFSIGQLELVRGPSSSLYGADAIGGTVQALSKELRLGQQNTQLNYFFRAASAESSHLVRAELISEQQNSAFLIAGNYKSFGDLTRGDDTEQPETGYDEHNFDIKFVHQFNPDFQLQLGAYYTKQEDVPRTHKTVYSVPFDGTTVGSELKRELTQERLLSYAKLLNNESYSWADSSEFTISWQSQEEFRDRLRSRDRVDTQGIDVNTLGLQAQFIKDFSHYRLIYGVDSYFDSVDSFSSKNDIQGPVADDAEYQWHGLYGQVRYPISSRLNLLAGLRANYMSAESDKVYDPTTKLQTNLDDSWHDIVGNALLNYDLSDNDNVYFGVAEGFRAPNLSDLTRLDSARSNEYEVPSLGLDSEHFINISAGYKYYSDKLLFELGSYYTFIRDQIERVPTGQQNEDGEFEITKINIGDGYLTGLEVDFSYWFNEQFSLEILGAYVTGKTDTYPTSEPVKENEYVSRLMPTTGRVNLHFQESDNLSFSLSLEAAERADRLSTRDKRDTQRIPPEGTSGYAVWSLHSVMKISEQLKVSVAFENLFDKDYRIHGSGQNEAGFNMVLGISGYL